MSPFRSYPLACIDLRQWKKSPYSCWSEIDHGIEYFCSIIIQFVTDVPYDGKILYFIG